MKERLTGQKLETSSGSTFLLIGQMLGKRQSVRTTAIGKELASSYTKRLISWGFSVDDLVFDRKGQWHCEKVGTVKGKKEEQ